MKKTTHDLPFDLQWQIRREVNFFFKFAFHPRKHSSITSAKNWVGGWVGSAKFWRQVDRLTYIYCAIFSRKQGSKQSSARTSLENNRQKLSSNGKGDAMNLTV